MGAVIGKTVTISRRGRSSKHLSFLLSGNFQSPRENLISCCGKKCIFPDSNLLCSEIPGSGRIRSVNPKDTTPWIPSSAAAETGFCNEFYYSRVFRKIYGVSPGIPGKNKLYSPFIFGR